MNARPPAHRYPRWQRPGRPHPRRAIFSSAATTSRSSPAAPTPLHGKLCIGTASTSVPGPNISKAPTSASISPGAASTAAIIAANRAAIYDSRIAPRVCSTRSSPTSPIRRTSGSMPPPPPSIATPSTGPWTKPAANSAATNRGAPAATGTSPSSVAKDWEAAFFEPSHAAHPQGRHALAPSSSAPTRQSLRHLFESGPSRPRRHTGQRPPIRLLDPRRRLRPRRRIPHRRATISTGPVNLASPNPLPNREFMADLREAWDMPNGLPAPRATARNRRLLSPHRNRTAFSRAAASFPPACSMPASTLNSPTGPKPPKTSSAAGAIAATEFGYDASLRPRFLQPPQMLAANPASAAIPDKPSQFRDALQNRCGESSPACPRLRAPVPSARTFQPHLSSWPLRRRQYTRRLHFQIGP